jgi:hypothetical protein
MPDLVHRRRLFAWIAIVPVAGLLSACQTPSAPKESVAAEKKAESYEEFRGDGTGGGMGDY